MINGVKVIDSHCHIYPDKIAVKATHGTDLFYGVVSTHDGTVGKLLEDGLSSGVDHFLVQSVATTPHQVSSINHFIAESVEKSGGVMTGLGTIHQDSDNIEADIEELISLGLRGIKIHPDIQQVAVDDPRFMKMYELCSGRIPILMHAGDKRYDFSNPDRILHVVKTFPKLTLIAAHLGGYSVWDEAFSKLRGIENLYFDCSSSFPFFNSARIKEIIRGYGCDRVMFGSDYPMWSPQKELENLFKLDLHRDEYEVILSGTAESIFGKLGNDNGEKV